MFNIDEIIEHLNEASYWIREVAVKEKSPDELLPDEDEEYDVYEPHVAEMLRAIDKTVMFFSLLKESFDCCVNEEACNDECTG